jgi:hypothetical protein
MVRHAGAYLSEENDVYARARARRLGVSRSAVVNEAVERLRMSSSEVEPSSSELSEAEAREILAMLTSFESDLRRFHEEKIRGIEELSAALTPK